MSVFDKELIINGKAVRSPEQQVYKNMEDIKTLFEKIQTWYNCTEELDEEDNTVLRSYTNVPDSASSGLLIDPVGNMFSITGGDETTLLITFYASIKGPQGEQGESGAELEIDDTGTSATKVWSSQKTSQELANAGKKYYVHYITWYYKNPSSHEWQINLTITNESSEKINTKAKLCEAIYEELGYHMTAIDDGMMECSGVYVNHSTSVCLIINGIAEGGSPSTLYLTKQKVSDGTIYYMDPMPFDGDVKDEVKEL